MPQPSTLDGPRLAAHSGNTKQLIVLLHGYGADGRDLIDLGHHWRTVLPDCAFVSPNAPEACALSPSGRQWFALASFSPQERLEGVLKARPALDAFLNAELERHGIDERALALVGFSQGTMMALHVGLRRKIAPLIVGFSGLLVAPERLHEAHARRANGQPPVILLTHGSEDPIIPFGALEAAKSALTAAGIACKAHGVPGLGHGIDARCMAYADRFLAHGFGVK